MDHGVQCVIESNKCVCQMESKSVELYKAQIPLRRICDKVRDKFPTKSWTLSQTFPVHCSGPVSYTHLTLPTNREV